MKLYDAYNLAEKIKSVLAPFCTSIEVAGSIRRARPEVNDIDIVCLPIDPAATALRQRCQANARLVQSGAQYLVVEMPLPSRFITHHARVLQIDIWLAHAGTRDLLDSTPSNWGSLLLCRTGSKEHNVWLCQRARALDLKWETSRGLVANPDTVKAKVIAGATEEEIFKCLGIDFIPPVERERHEVGREVAVCKDPRAPAEEVGRVSPCAPEAEPQNPDWAESFS